MAHPYPRPSESTRRTARRPVEERVGLPSHQPADSCLGHDDFGDVAVGLHDDLVCLERGLDWVLLVVHPLELLEGTAL
jgi:hypothetical protein